MTQTVWDAFLAEKAFAKGGKLKVMICGANFMKALAFYGKSYFQTTLNFPKLGISSSLYVSPTGEELALVQHVLFKGNTTLAGLGIVIDPDDIGIRYTMNPNLPSNQNIAIPTSGLPVYRENIQAAGTDRLINEYFAEVGLELRNESKHAVISGMTGPA